MAGMERRQAKPMRQAVCDVDGTVIEVGLPKSFGAQKIVSRPQMLDIEPQNLTYTAGFL